jgi:holin-like protein
MARILRYKLRRSLLLQILLITCFWLLGDWLVRGLRLPVSGSVAGLFLLLALFATGKFKTRNLSRGAEFFLANLLLLFLPAVVAVINHLELFGWVGIKVVVVILASTVIVMAVTALVVEACSRWIGKQKPMDSENAGEAQS